MKSVIGSFFLMLMTVGMLLVMAELQTQNQIQKELVRSMNQACTATQEAILKAPEDFPDAQAYSQRFQENLQRCLPKGKERFYKLRVYTADAENQLLDVEVETNWKSLSGKDRSIKHRETVISEIPEEEETPEEAEQEERNEE